MNKKVLLIVEGLADEPSFIRRLFEKCFSNTVYNVHSYKTNIHVISQVLFENYNDFDKGDVDIRLVLASLEEDKYRKKMLLDSYTDILMIFDLDPQHDHPHFDTIKRMANYYTDSTNQGKLFINYPMMQSYRDFSILPCPNFENKIVKLENMKEYKKNVGETSGFNDLAKYSQITFISIAIHHLKKANKIINNVFETPSKDEYLDMSLGRIYDIQLEALEENSYIYVLNTCIFILFDFNPSKMFNYIERHSDDLLI